MLWKLLKRIVLVMLISILSTMLMLLVYQWKTSPSGWRVSGLPPVVENSMAEVLRDLEIELERNQPGIEKELRPGITRRELEEIERKLGVTLHPEMQELYGWHDGLERGNELFPGYEFYSIEEAIQMNEELNQGFAKRGVGWLMAGEQTWLILFPDLAGDGYYFDYRREYAEGGVFFNFRENGYFIYFPSIKNLLTAVTECYRQGAYRGTETLDFDLEFQILRSYGKEIGS